MEPVLGVDLGTTYTAAAAVDGAGGKPEMLGLGNRTAEIPSVLLWKSDGEFLVGEPAERRAFGEPDRVARQFKRRLGDATPLLLGGSPFSPEALLGRLLNFVVARCAEQRGSQFAATVVCHPANWGPYRMELLGQAAKMAELENVLFLPEPVAAAVHYTDQARCEPGENVVVYDFGGGTFDVVVLRRTADAFEVVGTPAGLEHLGGLDLDEAVFGHVVQSVGTALGDLDPNDQAVVAAVSRLRDECKAAKEALSSDTDTSIPVLLPGVQTEVRLTRAEFESMIMPSVIDTVATTTRAIREAGLEPADVGRILLVGGSARVPLVSQLLAEELGRPTVIDVHPKHAIALGAARWGAIELSHGTHGATAAEAPVAAAAASVAVEEPEPVAEPEPAPEPSPESEAILEGVVAEESVQPPQESTQPAPTIPAAPPPAAPAAAFEPKKTGVSKAAVLIGVGALVAGAVAFGATQLGGGGGGGEEKDLQPISTSVVVDGDVAWTDSEIDITQGDKITIRATGEACHSENACTGPDGIRDPAAAEASKQFNLIEDARHNSLIGRIGKGGEPFYIGAFSSFRAQGTGRLFLGANDTGPQNNSGFYDADIEIEPA